MPHRIRVRDLYEALHERLQLTWVAGQAGADRKLLAADNAINSGIIAGPLNYIHPNRVQVIGPAELAYLDSLRPTNRLQALQQLLDDEPALIIVVNDVECPTELPGLADDAAVALMRSPLPDSQVLDNLQYYSSLFLSEKTTLHGVFLEVLGMGVLLTGDPAVGKSELALDLITRGSRLVAGRREQPGKSCLAVQRLPGQVCVLGLPSTHRFQDVDGLAKTGDRRIGQANRLLYARQTAKREGQAPSLLRALGVVLDDLASHGHRLLPRGPTHFQRRAAVEASRKRLVIK